MRRRLPQNGAQIRPARKAAAVAVKAVKAVAVTMPGNGVWNLLCIRPVVHICSVIKSVNSRMNKTSLKANGENKSSCSTSRCKFLAAKNRETLLSPIGFRQIAVANKKLAKQLRRHSHRNQLTAETNLLVTFNYCLPLSEA